MRRLLLATTVLIAAACSSGTPSADSDGTWVGTITIEGNVTTVVNESGSVWGGAARLVEEASIGVESGPDAYMFGRVAGIAVHDDRVHVLDSQVPAIRVFDIEGNYLRSIGREGQGPGEFERPSALEVGPEGRLFVRDRDQTRLIVFDTDGGVADALHLDRRLFGSELVSSPGNRVFAGVLMGRGATPVDFKYGVATLSLDGTDVDYREVPDFGWSQWSVSAANPGGGSYVAPVPFAPTLVWTVAPSGALAVGVSDEHRFELFAQDESRTVVRKSWDPVLVDPEEGEWNALAAIFMARATQPDWTWNGPEIPGHKPPYERFVADRSGRVWVIREGPGRRNPECVWPTTREEYRQVGACWTAPEIVEVFEEAGRFLGEVEVPDGFQWFPRPYITDDTVFAQAQDDAGTIMVKRYRLVLPGEQ